MPECPYCGETVSEDEELAHLASEHEGELGRIDRRRVEEWRGGSSRSVGSGVYGALAIALVLVVGGAFTYFAVSGGGGGTEEQIHEHGTLAVEVDGDAVNFAQQRYYPNGDFHFHASQYDDVWHLHPSEPGLRLTLAEALSELAGFSVDDDAITVDEERYAYDDANVSFTVDGETVDPHEYELRGVGPVGNAAGGEGDNVEIVIETGS